MTTDNDNSSISLQNESNLRHDLKNNLTILFSRLQLLASEQSIDTDSTTYRQLVDDIHILFQLMEQVGRQRSEIHRTTISGIAFLQHIYAVCLPLFDAQSQSLTLELPDTLPVLSLDTDMMKSALINLLKNASEASVTHQTVCLKAELSQNQLHITVRDNGRGMTKDMQSHIFEPHVSYKLGGTGIGLPSARQAILCHGGQLTCESEPGHGSIFHIWLPLI